MKKENIVTTISETPSIQLKQHVVTPKNITKSTTAIDSIQPISNLSKNQESLTMMMELIKSSISQKPASVKVFENRNWADWAKMHNLSVHQATAALVCDGLKNSPDIQVPDDIMESFEEHKNFAIKYNKMTEKKLNEFLEFTSSQGINTVQMKGIGFSMNYPNPQARFGGDIDCINYFRDKEGSISERNASKALDKLAKKSGMIVENHGSKHSMIKLNGMPIENHRYFLNEELGPLPTKLNKYLFKVLNPETTTLSHGTKVLVPSKEFNTIFISFHALQHFIGAGVNIKHLTDWAVHVNKNGLKIPNEIKGSEFEKFVYALTSLSNKYLGTKVNVPSNPELENEILDRMLQNDKKPKKTINPVKILSFKIAKIKRKNLLMDKYFEVGSTSLPKILFNTLCTHIRHPEYMKDLLKLK